MTDPIALFLPVFTPNLVPLVEEPEPRFDSMALDSEAAPEFSMTTPEPGFSEDGEAGFEAGEILVEDEAARIARAREEALSEAATATEAALAAQAADLDARHAEHLATTLAQERRRWAEEEGTLLAEQLRHGLGLLETTLAESVADILRPMLDRSMRAQAAEELRAAVAQILATPNAPVIRIGGPADLIEPLRSAFAPEAAIEVVPSDSPEVTLEAGDTTIRTQLQAWAATLDNHLGEAN